MFLFIIKAELYEISSEGERVKYMNKFPSAEGKVFAFSQNLLFTIALGETWRISQAEFIVFQKLGWHYRAPGTNSTRKRKIKKKCRAARNYYMSNDAL